LRVSGTQLIQGHVWEKEEQLYSVEWKDVSRKDHKEKWLLAKCGLRDKPISFIKEINEEKTGGFRQSVSIFSMALFLGLAIMFAFPTKANTPLYTPPAVENVITQDAIQNQNIQVIPVLTKELYDDTEAAADSLSEIIDFYKERPISQELKHEFELTRRVLIEVSYSGDPSVEAALDKIDSLLLYGEKEKAIQAPLRKESSFLDKYSPEIKDAFLKIKALDEEIFKFLEENHGYLKDIKFGYAGRNGGAYLERDLFGRPSIIIDPGYLENEEFLIDGEIRSYGEKDSYARFIAKLHHELYHFYNYINLVPRGMKCSFWHNILYEHVFLSHYLKEEEECDKIEMKTLEELGARIYNDDKWENKRLIYSRDIIPGIFRLIIIDSVFFFAPLVLIVLMVRWIHRRKSWFKDKLQLRTAASSSEKYLAGAYTIGGNSLLVGKDVKDLLPWKEKDWQKICELQKQRVLETMRYIVPALQDGGVITHGNGPEVGALLERKLKRPINLEKDQDFIRMHLADAVEETQKWIGLDIKEALIKLGIPAEKIEGVITHVRVDVADEGFEPGKAAKPVGLQRFDRNGKKIERPKVASPQPLTIVEIDRIKELLSKGKIVISCGGGGIPVDRWNKQKKLAAVIDKDLATALLVKGLSSRGPPLKRVTISTEVPCAYLNFGSPEQKEIHTVTVKKLKKYIKEGYFAEGSMLPKIQAAIDIIESGAALEVIITNPRNLSKVDSGGVSTRVVSSSKKVFLWLENNIRKIYKTCKKTTSEFHVIIPHATFFVFWATVYSLTAYSLLSWVGLDSAFNVNLAVFLSLFLAYFGAKINYKGRNTTDFFREEHFFNNAINGYAMSRLKEKGAPLKIYSAGAADFKETVSVAIVALENFRKDPESWKGINPYRDLTIYAVEFEKEIFEKGRTFIYSAAEVKYIDKDLLERYFVKKEKGADIYYGLKEEVVRMIRPIHKNLKDVKDLKGIDLVLFLNTIYLMGPVTLKKTMKNIEDSLSPKATVIVANDHPPLNPFSLFIKKSFSDYSQRFKYWFLENEHAPFYRVYEFDKELTAKTFIAKKTDLPPPSVKKLFRKLSVLVPPVVYMLLGRMFPKNKFYFSRKVNLGTKKESFMVKIRLVDERNFKDALAVHNRIWKGRLEFTEEQFRSLLKKNPNSFFVAEDPDGVIFSVICCATLPYERYKIFPEGKKDVRLQVLLESKWMPWPFHKIWLHYAVGIDPGYKNPNAPRALGIKASGILLRTTKAFSGLMRRCTQSPLNGYARFINIGEGVKFKKKYGRKLNAVEFALSTGRSKSFYNRSKEKWYGASRKDYKHYLNQSLSGKKITREEYQEAVKVDGLEAFLFYKEPGRGKSFKEFLMEHYGKSWSLKNMPIEWQDYIDFVRLGGISMEEYIHRFNRRLLSNAINMHAKNGARVIAIIGGGRKAVFKNIEIGDANTLNFAGITDYTPNNIMKKCEKFKLRARRRAMSWKENFTDSVNDNLETIALIEKYEPMDDGKPAVDFTGHEVALMPKKVFTGAFAFFANMSGEKFIHMLSMLKGRDLTKRELREAAAFAKIFPDIESHKNELIESISNWEGFECHIFSQRLFGFLQKLIPAKIYTERVEIRKITRTERFILKHSYLEIEVAGEKFILDTSADQFEIKNHKPYSYHPYNYHDLGVTMIPKAIFENPELNKRFWMYTKWERNVNQSHRFTSLLGTMLENIRLKRTAI